MILRILALQMLLALFALLFVVFCTGDAHAQTNIIKRNPLPIPVARPQDDVSASPGSPGSSPSTPSSPQSTPTSKSSTSSRSTSTSKSSFSHSSSTSSRTSKTPSSTTSSRRTTHRTPVSPSPHSTPRPSKPQGHTTQHKPSSVVHKTTFVSVTVSNGHTLSRTFTSTKKPSSTASSSPSLNKGGDSSSGLSDSAQQILGGVLGGIGGAILIGGIAVVVWRVWFRKRRSDEDEDLMSEQKASIYDTGRASPAGVLNDEGSTNGLERYADRGQNGNVNPSANF